MGVNNGVSFPLLSETNVSDKLRYELFFVRHCCVIDWTNRFCLIHVFSWWLLAEVKYTLSGLSASEGVVVDAKQVFIVIIDLEQIVISTYLFAEGWHTFRLIVTWDRSRSHGTTSALSETPWHLTGLSSLKIIDKRTLRHQSPWWLFAKVRNFGSPVLRIVCYWSLYCLLCTNQIGQRRIRGILDHHNIRSFIVSWFCKMIILTHEVTRIREFHCIVFCGFLLCPIICTLRILWQTQFIIYLTPTSPCPLASLKFRLYELWIVYTEVFLCKMKFFLHSIKFFPEIFRLFCTFV